MEFNYHRQLVAQKGACAPRSYYIPFPEPEFSFDKGRSAFVTELKNWQFGYFPSLPEDALGAALPHAVKVPHCWQRDGFGKDMYSNIAYPFPYDPPHIDGENACGIYETGFDLPEKTGRYYLNFDGADSCLYAFVNGKFAGYSTVSHSPAEFDITDLLQSGKNRIRAVVFRWCTGSYLEDQDKLRMSGIFRDAYILHRAEGHLTDYKIESDVAGGKGIVRFTADKECALSLFFGGEKVASAEGGSAVFEIENAKLWSAEQPDVYELVIFCRGEYIREYVGIRRVETDGSVLKLNGAPIKLKGVNRHSMTVNGYVETLSDLERDLKMFRKYNINAVRTSHYPPHPLFPVLCDLYGIYLMEEADLETHGTILQHNDPSDLGFFSDISSDERWKELYLHRARRMYERDKNRASVIIWSVGNESGWGCNTEAMALYLRGEDTRPVHYEGVYDPVADEWREENCLDLCSRMYPSLQDVCKILDRGVQKPFVLCEYTHAMGNSCGDVKDYWDIIYAREEMCGAFVWEWCNHNVYRDGKILYAGDFDEEDKNYCRDGNFCTDGLVDTDRTPHPSLLEVAEVYAPAAVERTEEGFFVRNRRDFLSLDDLACTCTLRKNGEALQTFSVDITGIPARAAKRAELPPLPSEEGYVTADFVFTKGGEYVGNTQFVLNDRLVFAGSEKRLQIERAGDAFAAEGASYRAAVDGFGRLCSLSAGGKEALAAPVSVGAYRIPIDNDVWIRQKWEKYRLETARFYPRSVTAEEGGLTFAGVFAAGMVEPAFDMRLRYTFFEDRISVRLQAEKRAWVDNVPRLGFVFRLDGQLCCAEYFGRGKAEAYEDRLLACPVGKYTDSVKNMYVPYVRPQENGSHCNSRYVTLSGGGSRFTVRSEGDFSFCVSPYALGDFKPHAHEMRPSDDVYLYVDYRMCGLGSHSCGPELQEKYQIRENTIDFAFDILLS